MSGHQLQNQRKAALDDITRELFANLRGGVNDGNELKRVMQTCPMCSSTLDSWMLDIYEEDGQQFERILWTCPNQENRSCYFPMNILPLEVFWVRRTLEEMDRGFIPPPNLRLLPERYHYLYPSIFSRPKNNEGASTSDMSTALCNQPSFRATHQRVNRSKRFSECFAKVANQQKDSASAPRSLQSFRGHKTESNDSRYIHLLPILEGTDEIDPPKRRRTERTNEQNGREKMKSKSDLVNQRSKFAKLGCLSIANLAKEHSLSARFGIDPQIMSARKSKSLHFELHEGVVPESFDPLTKTSTIESSNESVAGTSSSKSNSFISSQRTARKVALQFVSASSSGEESQKQTKEEQMLDSQLREAIDRRMQMLLGMAIRNIAAAPAQKDLRHPSMEASTMEMHDFEANTHHMDLVGIPHDFHNQSSPTKNAATTTCYRSSDLTPINYENEAQNVAEKFDLYDQSAQIMEIGDGHDGDEFDFGFGLEAEFVGRTNGGIGEGGGQTLMHMMDDDENGLSFLQNLSNG